MDPFLVHPKPPERAKPVSAVRSTLITTGLAVLRDCGLYDRYASALAPEHVETVRSLVAGAWLPTAFMLAHYQAWDSLCLSPEEIRHIGHKVGAGVGSNMLLTITKFATGAGVTPWTVFEQYGRLWARAFEGGGVRVERAGPKDATLFFSEIPFARSPYFRGSVLAIHEKAFGMFATKIVARALPGSVSTTAFALRFAWV